MRRLRYSQSEASTEINMSPLIDIVFILLIFFIVTTVFKDNAVVDVKVPKASSAQQIEQSGVILAVSADGQVFHGGRSIGINGVRSVISALVQENPDAPVIVRADAKALSGTVLSVVDAARSAGAYQVYQATAK